MTGRHKASGFTLMELVTVMTIAAILAAIAVPSFRYVTTSNRMSSEANSLLGDMQYARAEAIKEGQPVAVCVANAALTSCRGGTPPWTNGWLVFSNPLGDGVVPNVQAILRKRPALTASNSTDTFASAVATVIFNREGFASGLAASPTLFTLHDVTANPSMSRCVWLEPTGFLRVVAGGVGTCA